VRFNAFRTLGGGIRRSIYVAIGCLALQPCVAAGAARGGPGPGDKPTLSTEALLDLDQPATLPGGPDHRISVSNDGIAHIHIKPRKGEAASTIDLDLDDFTADGHPPIVVGFEVSSPVSVPQMAAQQSFPVSAQGTEVKLNAAGLEPGVDYNGHLSATVGNQRIRWNIILTRPMVVPPFLCPNQPVTLDGNGDVTLTLKQVIPLTQSAIGLRLSSFTSKDHDTGLVGFPVPPGVALPAVEVSNQPIHGGQIAVPLHTEGLIEGGSYTGMIAFVADDAEFGACPLTLQVPTLARAELDTDAKTLTLAISQDFRFDVPADASVSLRLFEKTGLRHVDGISARLNGPTDSPQGSFDVARYVRFYTNGAYDPNLLRTDATGSPTRIISKGGQMPVKMVFYGLPHGKYTFSLQFDGSNTQTPGPKVDVTVNVRNDAFWPALAIFVSVCISFLVTHGVRNWRARVTIRNRLNDLSSRKFEPYGALPGVVFNKAIISQTRALLDAGAWLAAPPASIDGLLDRVERINSIMARYTEIQDQLNHALVVDSIKYHYREEIKTVMNRITAQALDQTLTDSILADLGKIAAFMNPTPQTWYWAKLISKIKLDLAQAKQIPALDDHRVHEVFEKLNAILTGAPPTYQEDKAPPIDTAFWMLDLLVHRPDDAIELSAKYQEKHYNFPKVCEDADEMMWRKIKDRSQRGRIRIVAVEEEEPSQRLKPFKFQLRFDDAQIGASYLVTNLITYEWKFNLVRNFTASSDSWTVFVDAPRVTAFSTGRGRLTVSVRLIRRRPGSHQSADSDRWTLHGEKEYPIDDNDDLLWSRQIDRRAILVFFFVVALTVITAIPSLYLGKLDFGSWSDYIAILVWAIGVDQSKNLMQLVSPDDKSSSK